ncbi:hypothetical protein [Microbulbifer epialgicus]|uniref:Helix-turn-helix n=1 Tax=Microbulbifer epialgicus TaxID=393907 RepID=A0ABV4NTA5_9GAMM
MSKGLSGRRALSEHEKEAKAAFNRQASDWIRSEILRSGLSRDEVARRLSEKRERDISVKHFNKMLSNGTNDQGFIFEIASIIGITIIGVPTR